MEKQTERKKISIVLYRQYLIDKYKKEILKVKLSNKYELIEILKMGEMEDDFEQYVETNSKAKNEIVKTT